RQSKRRAAGVQAESATLCCLSTDQAALAFSCGNVDPQLPTDMVPPSKKRRIGKSARHGGSMQDHPDPSRSHLTRRVFLSTAGSSAAAAALAACAPTSIRTAERGSPGSVAD